MPKCCGCLSGFDDGACPCSCHGAAHQALFKPSAETKLDWQNRIIGLCNGDERADFARQTGKPMDDDDYYGWAVGVIREIASGAARWAAQEVPPYA